MSWSHTIGRHWHFARHLRPEQIGRGILFRLVKPTPDLRPAPPTRQRSGLWLIPPQRAQSLTSPTTFKLLNVERELGKVGWDGGEVDDLWRYNQHYFDDLGAVGFAERAPWHHDVLARWVRENPPGQGVGWNPHPTSVRIVNWIKWCFAGGALSSECMHSLAVQARWLSRRIEHHRLGNHLIANAKALVFAGAFFSGAEAESWRSEGARILRSQLADQVLADGGHYELSPMYHSIVLEDLIDLINLRCLFPSIRADLPDDLDHIVHSMLTWLAVMTHSDGQIALFNDAAFGMALAPRHLADYAQKCGVDGPPSPQEGCTHLGESGYIRMQRGPAVAILDVGSVGPDRCPGHCHADTLSFELSLFGQRVVANSGVSQYGRGPVRDRQRGTASHNTVTINAQNSSDVWGGFRVGRRARVYDVCIGQTGAAIQVKARHDGYRHLEGRPQHVREWRLSDREFRVRDTIEPCREGIARYHLTPQVESAGDAWMCGCTGRVVRVDTPIGSYWEDSEWHPEFGLSLRSRRLAVPIRSDGGCVAIRWE